MRIPEDEPDCYTAFSNDQKIVPVLHKELERKYCMLVCARTGAVKNTPIILSVGHFFGTEYRREA